MNKENQTLLRKALLLLTTTAAALGMLVGLPMKKASAASQDTRMAPAAALNQQRASMTIIQPRFVSPSAVNLLKIADMALSDGALAERIFREPDAVAAQYHLSPNERLVLRHMDGAQFQTARADAARLVATRLSAERSMRMPPGATDVRLITERMIVGRAILAAVGRSYLEAASANACCPWSKAIEVGVGGDPALYNSGFARPEGGMLHQ